MTLNVFNAKLHAAYLSILLGVVAGFQLIGQSRDFSNYLLFFQRFSPAESALDLGHRFEPAFTALVYLLAYLGLQGKMIYTVIATSTISVKLLAIPAKKMVLFVYTVAILYFLSRYFILFEMTVLRAACAFSIGFVVFSRKTDYRYRASEIILLLLAALFHYSATVFMFIYIWRQLSIQKIVLVSTVLLVLVSLTSAYALTVAPQFLFVFSTYYKFNPATAVPVPFMLDMLFLAWAMVNWDKLDIAMKRCLLGMSVAVALHFSLLQFSLIAGRFRELLSVFVLILVVRSCMSDSRLLRESAVLFAAASGLLHLYLMTVYDPLLS